MEITPLTYHEAAKLLGKGYSTIRAAVAREAITRLPSVGLEQRVIKEQVSLFLGKSQIRIDSLSEEELLIWKQYKRAAKAEIPQGLGDSLYTSTQVAQLLASYEEQRESLSPEEKKSSLPDSPSWQELPSWQALHSDIKNLSTGETWGLIILLLVLIGAYLAVRYLNKDVTFNKYIIDQNLESAKEYLPQPERVLSLVDEIAQSASSEEEASERVIEAIQQLAMAA